MSRRNCRQRSLCTTLRCVADPVPIIGKREVIPRSGLPTIPSESLESNQRVALEWPATQQRHRTNGVCIQAVRHLSEEVGRLHMLGAETDAPPESDSGISNDHLKPLRKTKGRPQKADPCILTAGMTLALVTPSAGRWLWRNQIDRLFPRRRQIQR